MDSPSSAQPRVSRVAGETEHAVQIDRLRRKLGRLLDICRDHPSFAKDHRIVAPGPPLLEAEIDRFESDRGIRLPEDYREFVAGIAHGGPGPYEGILPLDCWAEASPWPTGNAPPDYLACPSPLRPDMPRDDRWYESLGCYHERRYQGTMAISRRGGTRYGLLIVTGQCRGRVVLADVSQGAPRFAPQIKFLDWYEDWADETLECAEFETS